MNQTGSSTVGQGRQRGRAHPAVTRATTAATSAMAKRGSRSRDSLVARERLSVQDQGAAKASRNECGRKVRSTNESGNAMGDRNKLFMVGNSGLP